MKSVKVVPNIIRALGTIPKRTEEYLRNINTGIELAALQRTVFLGSVRILRRVIRGGFLRPDGGTEISVIEIPAV